MYSAPPTHNRGKECQEKDSLAICPVSGGAPPPKPHQMGGRERLSRSPPRDLRLGMCWSLLSGVSFFGGLLPTASPLMPCACEPACPWVRPCPAPWECGVAAPLEAPAGVRWVCDAGAWGVAGDGPWCACAWAAGPSPFATGTGGDREGESQTGSEGPREKQREAEGLREMQKESQREPERESQRASRNNQRELQAKHRISERKSWAITGESKNQRHAIYIKA